MTHRLKTVALAVTGIVFLLVATVGFAYPLAWSNRQHAAATSLLERAPDPVERAARLGSADQRCIPTKSDGGEMGVLVVPALGLVAPVLNGVSDGVLNVAVGHDPETPVPGKPGEAILEAHDVSYFTDLDRLRQGDEVIWAVRCRRWVFRVTEKTVSVPGAFLPTPESGAGLALITCWPTDALFWTADRFVVETTLIASSSASTLGPSRAPAIDLQVPAPRALVQLGLGLNDNPVVLGTLQVVGSPASTWRLGPGPLDAARVGLEAYIALRRTAALGNRRWWSALTLPGVPLPSSWSYSAVVDTVVRASGDRVDSVELISASGEVLLKTEDDKLVAATVRE